MNRLETDAIFFARLLTLSLLPFEALITKKN